MSARGGIHHVDLAVADVERSLAFYLDLLGPLGWVEEITLIADGHAHKESFDALKPHFSEEEIAWLTLAAAMINTWNRIAIASRAQYDRAQLQQRMAGAKVAEPA